MKGKNAMKVLIILVVLMAALVWSAGALASDGDQEGPGAVTIQPLEVVEAAEPDYKAMYFAALARVQELEAALQEAIDLALGYRQDWAEQRDIAEARKVQTDQALKLADTLMTIIRDMKDTINRQHEIIMRLTAPKKMSLQVLGGAVIYPREPTNPGFLIAAGVSF